MPEPAPTPASADRNLLFGVLALQADLLDQRGWLSPEDQADVERLLVRKLKKHGGDARASLAEVTTDPVRRSLAGLEDADVRRSLAGCRRQGELVHSAVCPNRRKGCVKSSRNWVKAIGWVRRARTTPDFPGGVP
jgi:hypothetical protein